jgi:hypothetical protein
VRTMRVTCSLSSVQSVQGGASAGAAGHQHQRHEEVHAKKALFSMDPSASGNCRPVDASANCRPEDPANDSSRLLPQLVQRPSKADRHVDVTGICASNLESVYQLCEVLGKGSFAVVKTARRKRDGKMYAIKILEKTNPGELWDMGHVRKRKRRERGLLSLPLRTHHTAQTFFAERSCSSKHSKTIFPCCMHPTYVSPTGVRWEGGAEELIGGGEGPRGYPPRI